MELASARDWIIILVGALEIILLIVFIIVSLVLYAKINKIIKEAREKIQKLEHLVTSPYYRVGSIVFGVIARGLGLFKRKKEREGK
jgi:hypothetical protein